MHMYIFATALGEIQNRSRYIEYSCEHSYRSYFNFHLNFRATTKHKITTKNLLPGTAGAGFSTVSLPVSSFTRDKKPESLEVSFDLKEPLRSLSTSAAMAADVGGATGRCCCSREKSGLSSPARLVSFSMKSLLLGVADGERGKDGGGGGGRSEREREREERP